MTITTSEYQKKPDFYTTKDECKLASYTKISTNGRYKNFFQTHFTAGDEEQFHDYWDQINNEHEKDIASIPLDTNLFKNQTTDIWYKNCDLQGDCVKNTFRYMFHKFKKGIYVRILDNKLRTFLPFSNANFVNEWSDNIKVPDDSIFKYVSKVDNRVYNEKYINQQKNTWFSNNGLIRYEYPINEGDTNTSNFKNMLEELCENRQIPDIEFFINRRDFPLLSKGNYEPYYDLWDSHEKPLVSHNYDQYSPILSMSKMDSFGDILIPTHEDWSRIQSKFGKYFVHSNRSCDSENSNISWDDKIPTAIFRGSSTGAGVTIHTNQRLKVAHLSFLRTKDPRDNLYYIDAGITNWNIRPKKHMKKNNLQSIKIHELPFGLVDKLSYQDQSKYKYVIHIAGHVFSFRLSLEMSMKSVILLVTSKWKIWFFDKLQPYVHFVPVKEDLSDLIDQIKWCKDHDEECKQIAQNAFDFYQTFLQKDGIFDFLQITLMNLKQKMGVYQYPKMNVLDKQIQEEFQYMMTNNRQEFPKNPSNKKLCIYEFPKISRCYELLNGFRMILNKIFHEKNTLTQLIQNPEIIFENKNKTIVIDRILISGGVFITRKQSKNMMITRRKSKEIIHECFIGLNCINEIMKQIPNFCYTFGMYNNNKTENEILFEYIEGQSLFDYLKSDEFETNTYVNILLQICLSLHVAQEMFCFTHYDLTPWNILLKRTKEPVDIEYVIKYNKVVKIRTNIIPIIIDYGKSYAIIDHKKHGFVNMFEFSSVHDIISLLTTSLFQILSKQNVPKNDFNNLLKLSNFLTGTRYHPQKFSTAREIKTFLNTSKKFSKLLFDDKYEMEKIRPMNLFDFITENLSHSLSFEITKDLTHGFIMSKGDSNQIFHYLAAETNEDRVKSFVQSFTEIILYDTIKENPIENIYETQMVINRMKNFVENFKTFLKSINISSVKYEDIFMKCKKNLMGDVELIDMDLDEMSKFSKDESFVKMYDENILMNPKKIQRIKECFEKKEIDVNKIREFLRSKEMLYMILLHRSSLNKNKIIKSYYKLLNIESVSLRNTLSSIETFHSIIN